MQNIAHWLRAVRFQQAQWFPQGGKLHWRQQAGAGQRLQPEPAHGQLFGAAQRKQPEYGHEQQARAEWGLQPQAAAPKLEGGRTLGQSKGSRLRLHKGDAR